MKIISRTAFTAVISMCVLALTAVSGPGLAFNNVPTTKGLHALTTRMLDTPPAPLAVAADVAPIRIAAVDVRDVTPDLPDLDTPDSLAEAVAAQSSDTEVDSELQCLATSVYYEAKGEPLEGQLAVAHVIVNRAQSGRFPTNVCGVVRQPNQFSFVRNGAIPTVSRGGPMWKTALAVARVALDDGWKSPAPKALFFHARRVAPRWNLTRVASIGNHVFYR